MAKGVSQWSGKLVMAETRIGILIALVESIVILIWMFREGSIEMERILTKSGRGCLCKRCDQIIEIMIRRSLVEL